MLAVKYDGVIIPISHLDYTCGIDFLPLFLHIFARFTSLKIDDVSLFIVCNQLGKVWQSKCPNIYLSATE